MCHSPSAPYCFPTLLRQTPSSKTRTSCYNTYTDYAMGWKVQGWNPDEDEIFRTRPEGPWDRTSFPHNGYRVPFPKIKRPGRGVERPSPSSSEGKERVEVYLYFRSRSSWPVPPPPLRCGPKRVMASSFLRLLDHTQRRITVGRTPLDEWSARRRDLYLYNTQHSQ